MTILLHDAIMVVLLPFLVPEPFWGRSPSSHTGRVLVQEKEMVFRSLVQSQARKSLEAIVQSSR